MIRTKIVNLARLSKPLSHVNISRTKDQYNIHTIFLTHSHQVKISITIITRTKVMYYDMPSCVGVSDITILAHIRIIAQIGRLQTYKKLEYFSYKFQRYRIIWRERERETHLLSTLTT